MKMIQSKSELDLFHENFDPWGYENNNEDIKRKEILLNEIPQRDYIHVLDIGCGHGFVTKDLPGKEILGIDISKAAIDNAIKGNLKKNISYKQCSIYDIDKYLDKEFDLIVITGVLYPQYIGDSSNLIYILIDKVLKKGGILVSVHINEWYNSHFPYLKLKQVYYNYREYIHNLEIYIK